MEMTVTFPGGARVDARLGSHIIRTDQPVRGGGNDSAPAPFSLFLASIGTCAGIYVLGFCNKRGVSTDGIQIVQRMVPDMRTGLIGRIELDIKVPPEFPEKYRASLVRSAELCAVKKHIEQPPAFQIYTKEVELAT